MILQDLLYGGLKCALKCVVYSVCPPLGVAWDMYDASAAFAEGDYIGAFSSIASGAVNVYSLRATQTAKNVAKMAGKEAAISETREQVKDNIKHITKQMTRNVNSGFVSKERAAKIIKTQSKQISKKFGGDLGKDLRCGMLDKTAEHLLRKSPATILQESVVIGTLESVGDELPTAVLEDVIARVFDNLPGKAIYNPTSPFATYFSANEAMKPFLSDMSHTLYKLEVAKAAVVGALKLSKQQNELHDESILDTKAK